MEQMKAKVAWGDIAGILLLTAGMVMLGVSVFLCFSNDIWYDELFTMGLAGRPLGDLVAITAKDVLDEAKAGDEMALEVVELVGRYLGLMMAQVAMTVDPEMFVIGGGVSRAGQFLLDRIEKYYDHYSPISKNKGKVGLAKLGNDAGIYGAARLVLG